MKRKKNYKRGLFDVLFGSDFFENFDKSMFDESDEIKPELDMDFDDVPSEPKQLSIDESTLNKVEEEGETDTHKWKTQEFSSPDGSFKMFRRTMTTKYIYGDKEPKSGIKTLEYYKTLRDKAVAEQKFEEAAKYRDEISKLEGKK